MYWERERRVGFEELQALGHRLKKLSCTVGTRLAGRSRRCGSWSEPTRSRVWAPPSWLPTCQPMAFCWQGRPALPGRAPKPTTPWGQGLAATAAAPALSRCCCCPASLVASQARQKRGPRVRMAAAAIQSGRRSAAEATAGGFARL